MIEHVFREDFSASLRSPDCPPTLQESERNLMVCRSPERRASLAARPPKEDEKSLRPRVVGYTLRSAVEAARSCTQVSIVQPSSENAR
jgi:hypothetical protein